MQDRLRTLGDRLRATREQQAREIEDRLAREQADAERAGVVPMAGASPGARLAARLLESRQVRGDPLAEPDASAFFSDAPAEKQTWYRTHFASDIASDIQQSQAVNVILHAAENASARREDDRQRQREREVAAAAARGPALESRLKRAAIASWSPTLRDLAGDILRIVHPDTRDPALLREFTPEELHAVYQQAVRAHTDRLSEMVSDFVRLAERILVWRARRMVAEGMSLAQVAEREPRIAAHLESVRWLRFVKQRQLALVKQFVDEARRQEESVNSHIEGFSILSSVIQTILAYAGASQEPTRTRLADVHYRLEQFERLSKQLGPDDSPLSTYKSDALHGAIKALVGPVMQLAETAHAAVERREAGGDAQAVDAARRNVGRFLEYVDSAAQSYVEYLEQRTGGGSPGRRL